MKKIILLCVLTFYSVTCLAQMTMIDMEKVRKLYQKAAQHEKACEQLISLLGAFNLKNNPLLMGYKASATMMMANHTWNPFSKLAYFKEGKRMLAKAVKINKKNVELRFLRLAAQAKTPSFLGYDDFIKNDKQFLRQTLPKIRKKRLKEFILTQLKKLNLFNKTISFKSANTSL